VKETVSGQIKQNRGSNIRIPPVSENSASITMNPFSGVNLTAFANMLTSTGFKRTPSTMTWGDVPSVLLTSNIFRFSARRLNRIAAALTPGPEPCDGFAAVSMVASGNLRRPHPSMFL
jgi:hypothetical protein